MKMFARGNGSRTKTAAVVEDDEELILVYSRILRRLGYNSVLVARNGEEIIRRISGGSTSPGIVIMEYGLPTINGLDAAKEILRHRPDTKIIIATVHDEIGEKAALMGLSFLPKPFSMKKLVREIWRLSGSNRLMATSSGSDSFRTGYIRSSNLAVQLVADKTEPIWT
jgi:DNA-binding NtrC family response regulator